MAQKLHQSADFLSVHVIGMHKQLIWVMMLNFNLIVFYLCTFILEYVTSYYYYLEKKTISVLLHQTEASHVPANVTQTHPAWPNPHFTHILLLYTRF